MPRNVTFADNIGNSTPVCEDSLSEKKHPDPKSPKVAEHTRIAYPIGKPASLADPKLTDQEKMNAAAAAFIQKRLLFLNDPAAQKRHEKKQKAKQAKAEKNEADKRRHLRPGY